MRLVKQQIWEQFQVQGTGQIINQISNMNTNHKICDYVYVPVYRICDQIWKQVRNKFDEISI